MALSWLSLIILLISSTSPVCAQKFDFPRLSLHCEKVFQDPERRVQVSVINDFKTFFFNQTLDHFNYRPESYTTFKQRYLINSKYWGGANSSAPIFIYFGGEEPIDDDLKVIGFLTENAAQFKALLIYIEHRYYGKSIPLGKSFEEALKDPNARGYFSSSQALADYAAIIRHVKEKLKAKDCPVIVVGCSYAGMLASWFRLKYPHLAFGALASSAPILYFDGITPEDGYFSVVTKDFKEASETCYQTIRDSWAEIDRVASEPDGLSRLSKIFKTCRALESGDELKSYLIEEYAGAAQYDEPPTYPVEVMCRGIDGANASENGILVKIFAGVVAISGNSSCYIVPPSGTTPSQGQLGWKWQRCSEMIMGVGITNNSMFQPDPFNISNFIDRCNRSYGVMPRPHWITTYYGGHDTEQVLRRFGSNIIFSNGLRDPYSSGGILKNISDTIVAFPTQKGSHCLDILSALQDDPSWLVRQRKKEIEIIKGWITKYYADLLALRQ
ncbi:lysosomal Pro-X carboxypeptidase-like [Rhodamnia argentea]|uniref:Lysosomal Pro-X carboxypeptidase-like n=1 Tax=Rhodamnia argentea TaxID=178133 RepID=A0A8B8Q1D7_9MYRT|nr:lysosomal Pro-X carboxypeptidase-like [Rhodamnia argentea]